MLRANIFIGREQIVNLSHEDRLLLYCSQTKTPEVTLDQIKSLLSLPLNWDDILESAFRHGIAPLLYHNPNNA